MTREEARKAAEVMLAYANGEEIEFKYRILDQWEVYNPQSFKTLSFNWNEVEYRVKTKPKYRPFKTGGVLE